MDNFNFIKDREVVFETDKKVLIGKLFFIDKKGTYIIFRYVQNFSDNKLISKGNMTFYKPEIKSIRYFSSSSSSDVTTASDIQPNDNVLDTAITSKNIIIDEPTNKDNENIENSITKSFLQLDDMIRINHSVAHVKYITKIDSTYHDAIRDIKNQYEIGVNIEGNVHKFGRAHIALIAISTLSNIYLFDILWLGRVPELKAVFTNKRIEKIIHNSRRFTNIIQFQNVFDTMVAHAATDKIHRMLSIQECVAVNFDLPDCFINVPKDIDFTARPIVDKFRKIAAQNVAYLLLLQKYFTRKMMQPFYDAVKKYENETENIKDKLEMNEIEWNGQKELNEIKDLKEVDKFELKISLKNNE